MTKPRDDRPDPAAALGAAEVARRLEQGQIARFGTRGGHGFAAEDANTLADRLRGRDAHVVGQSSVLNGADRVVDGVAIQTKYHTNARATVDAAFDLTSGRYRYSGQLLEVPKDQYADCVRVMEERIREGRVPGVTDPARAPELVREGAHTYRQARNIARAGTIDSLIYDAKTLTVTSTYVLAISFAITYAQARWSGASDREAVARALRAGLAAGATTLVTGIVTAQCLRTRNAALGAVVVRNGVRVAYRSAAGKAAIEGLAEASLGRAVYGAAAVNHVSKLLRTTVVSSTIATAVTSAPDFYRVALARSISWPQFTKNVFVNGAGIATGVAGWLGGATIGAVAGPPGALVGGLVGAIAFGTAGAKGAKRLGDALVEDDAKAMMAIVQKLAEELAFDYALSDEEVARFADELKRMIDGKWLRAMFAAGRRGDPQVGRYRFALERIERLCQAIADDRPRVLLPPPATLQLEMDEIVAAALEEPAQ